MRRIIYELKDGFGLKDKHISILDCLYEERFTAKELSKKAQIPLGRIYDFLNDLMLLQLIDRTPKKPYYYSIENPQEKIKNFLKQKFDEFVTKNAKIFDLLEKTQDREMIDIIHSGDEYAFRLIQIISEAKTIKTIVRHDSLPFIMYPSDSKDFAKARQAVLKNRETLAHTTHQTTFLLYKAVMEAYQSGKKFMVIMEKKSLDSNRGIIKKELGSEFLVSMKEDILEKLKTNNLKIFAITEHLPMQIYITEDKVFLSIIHLGITTGVVIRSNKAVELYNDYFDDMTRRSTPLQQYL
jgi:sugar-specific transcriptional regulator TrmB